MRTSSSKSDAEVLSGFLANEIEDGCELRERFEGRLLRIVGPLPAALSGLGLEEDIAQRTWELVCRAGQDGYDAGRGEVLSYLEGHARNAKRDVCAAHVPPGNPTRPAKDAEGVPIPLNPTVPLGTSTGKDLVGVLADPVDEIGRMIDEVFVDDLVTEAAFLGESLVVELLGRMRADRGLSEAAAELGVSRFAAGRAVDRFARALASAA